MDQWLPNLSESSGLLRHRSIDCSYRLEIQRGPGHCMKQISANYLCNRFDGVGCKGFGCTWVKPGRFGSLFVLCFLALGGHCLQMLCLPGFGTHANAQNLPHFRAFPASIQERCPPKCLFFMANAKLPNRPVFALLQDLDRPQSMENEDESDHPLIFKERRDFTDSRDSSVKRPLLH